MSTTAPQFYDTTLGFVSIDPVGPHRLADYLGLPDDPQVELIEGRYYVSPSPNTLHQTISITLSTLLFNTAKKAEGRAWAAPCDVVLADHTVVQPDLLYFSKDRRPPMGPRITTAPDLVIEILSENRRSHDRVHKLKLYAEFGVAEYWIVDPTEREFDFMVLVDGKYQVQPQTGPRYQSPRQAELAIDLADFWQEIDRQTLEA